MYQATYFEIGTTKLRLEGQSDFFFESMDFSAQKNRYIPSKNMFEL